MKTNNKGFSLLELIVVIAIIGILVTAVSFSVSLIFNASAQQAANDFSSLISRCRVATLSGESNPTVVLSYDSTEGEYIGTLYYGVNPIDTEVLSDRSMSVNYSLAGTSGTLAGSTTLTIDFNSNGSLSDAVIDAGEASEQTIDVSNQTAQITFAGGGTTQTISVTALTGYITLD